MLIGIQFLLYPLIRNQPYSSHQSIQCQSDISINKRKWYGQRIDDDGDNALFVFAYCSGKGGMFAVQTDKYLRQYLIRYTCH